MVLKCCLAQEGYGVLTEKILVLDKHLSGMSARAVGCELNINQSTIYIKSSVFKQKHK